MLGADDGAPVVTVNAHGSSAFLLTGDHAGNAVPATLGGLGIGSEDLRRHIGWDIGIMAHGTALAARLDAPFVAQRFSRLVIDCNRDPRAADAMPASSDGTAVPGNAALSPEARFARRAAIHDPYHAAVAALITKRTAQGRPTWFLALHSFTPVMGGDRRPWHVGVLYGGGDTGFARHLLAAFGTVSGLVVGDNQPYAMDGTDHSVPRHAIAGGLPYAEIEIRQDLIGDEAGVARWTAIVADAVLAAQKRRDSPT